MREFAEDVKRGLRRIGYATAGLLFVMVLIVSAAVYVRAQDLDRQIAHNRQRIADTAQIRAKLIRDSKRADYRLCRAIEALKRQNRGEEIRSYEHLSQTLKVLGIKRTPAIVRLARRQLDRALRLNAEITCKRGSS